MSPPTSAAGAEILLVEDSETQALHLRLTLEAQGFKVERVATAEAALESLNTHMPNLVIADYHLPGMNGDELARQLRLNMRTRAVPVLMLTEARERDAERHGLESGVDAYVSKSADQELILLRIRALIRQVSSGSSETPAPTGAGGVLFRRAAILLVSDHAPDEDALRGVLIQDGYLTTIVEDDAAAVAEASGEDKNWDAIIVNLQDDLQGTALCRRLSGLRERPGGTVSPSFQLITFSDGDTAARRSATVRNFEAGADDVIPRSIDPEVLKVRIRSLLRRKLVDDESRRISSEAQEREMVLERAKAEALAAEALARANAELETANRQLVETQTQLVHAAKMASLGELVAGIAHEINNPLAYILAHQDTIERLSRDIQAGLSSGEVQGLDQKAAKARDRLSAVRVGLTRIQELVLNLRKFSRLEEGGYETVNVPEAIDMILALLAPKLTGRISVERRFGAPQHLTCSPALLNQAVMNIVSNAADAIDAGGRILIETRADGESYTIAVSDSGPGVPQELRERIFEPFFTTKPVGEGTGLGLAIAYRVVQAHKGSIKVVDGAEGGASFVLTVPLRASS
ncbi:two-component system NtrC family sensor kinase [Rhodoligotrophos appendicifer]|uniref:response regulator n=1 Tax=Rhodoligotrophos appendicifer TaxID=987056 RepID=UPI0011848466|nr:response regulator [Rhodoligotrophos appendicifer]